MKLNEQKVGLVLGLLLGGVHLLWIVLVAIGWGQILLNFIFWLHLLGNPYQVAPFDITAAILLVIITFAVGYIVGWIFATLWNKFYKAQK